MLLKRVLERGASFSKVATKRTSSFTALTPRFGLEALKVSVNTPIFSSPLPVYNLRSYNNDSEQRQRRPRREQRSERPLTSPVLLVRGFPWDKINEANIRELFQGLEISKVDILKEYGTDRNSGFIFVEFASIEDAQNALRQTRGITVDERSVFVKPSSAEERALIAEDHSKPSLSVVVRRIPNSISEEEIRRIFNDTKIEKIVYGDSQVYLQFASKGDQEAALQKNGAEFGRGKISVSTANDFDVKKNEQNPQRIVRLRGAPRESTEEDFRAFFKDLQVLRVTPTTREGMSGQRVPGDVYVEFANAEDAKAALQLDRQNMGQRYVQVFRSSRGERKRKLLGSNPTQTERSSGDEE